MESHFVRLRGFITSDVRGCRNIMYQVIYPVDTSYDEVISAPNLWTIMDHIEWPGRSTCSVKGHLVNTMTSTDERRSQLPEYLFREGTVMTWNT